MPPTSTNILETILKQTTGTTAIAAVVIGAATGVFAAGYGPGYGPGWGGHRGMMGGPGGTYGPGMMGGPGGMYGPGMMGGTGYTDQQISDAKAALGITPDQEDAWNAYVGAIQGRTALMQAHRQGMFTHGPVSPEQRQAFHQQGYNQMQQVFDARRNLYSVLTPQQRSAAGNLIGR